MSMPSSKIEFYPEVTPYVVGNSGHCCALVFQLTKRMPQCSVEITLPSPPCLCCDKTPALGKGSPVADRISPPGVLRNIRTGEQTREPFPSLPFSKNSFF